MKIVKSFKKVNMSVCPHVHQSILSSLILVGLLSRVFIYGTLNAYVDGNEDLGSLIMTMESKVKVKIMRCMYSYFKSEDSCNVFVCFLSGCTMS